MNVDLNEYVGRTVCGHYWVNGANQTAIMGRITHAFDDTLLVSAGEIESGAAHAIRVAPLWKDVPVGESPLVTATNINGPGVEIDLHLDGWMTEITRDEANRIFREWGYGDLI